MVSHRGDPRRAFLDYTRIALGVPLYRRVRWGRHLEFFVLDTRSYRDGNRAPDQKDQPKTILGGEQHRWLEEALAASTARIFPRREFDSGLGPERLLFHGPDRSQAVSSWEEALGWFNFGVLDLDGRGALELKILDARGRQLWSRVLTPQASAASHAHDKHPPFDRPERPWWHLRVHSP